MPWSFPRASIAALISCTAFTRVIRLRLGAPRIPRGVPQDGGISMRKLLLGAAALAACALIAAPAQAAGTCNLGPGGQVKHVVVLQFDNTHLARDAAGVPSDLEQMPALKGFLESNGSLLSNDHTILISHTAGGIVSTETGLYPDRNGLTVTNSYEFFDKLASTGVNFSSAFKYWPDPTGTNDPLPMMITSGQKVT